MTDLRDHLQNYSLYFARGAAGKAPQPDYGPDALRAHRHGERARLLALETECEKLGHVFSPSTMHDIAGATIAEVLLTEHESTQSAAPMNPLLVAESTSPMLTDMNKLRENHLEKMRAEHPGWLEQKKDPEFHPDAADGTPGERRRKQHGIAPIKHFGPKKLTPISPTYSFAGDVNNGFLFSGGRLEEVANGRLVEGPCLDPDKMNGAGDQFPGSDYDLIDPHKL